MRTLRIFCGAVLIATALTSPLMAAASARDMYTAALSRERALQTGTPSLKELRAVIAAYQAIVRRYPRSGYSDNALWQAAGVALDAYRRYGQARDRATGLTCLDLLASEYPSSSLVRQIAARRKAFDAQAAPRRAGRPVTPAPAAEARMARTSGSVTPVGSPAATGVLREIRRTRLDDAVRVILEIDGDLTSYYEERLTSPDRVFLDLKDVSAAPHLEDAVLTYTDDVVRSIRLGRHPGEITRVVLDLEDVGGYSIFVVENPLRIVIDCRRGGGEAPLAPGTLASLVAEARQPPAADVPEPLPSRASAPVPHVETPVAPAANSNGGFSLARQLGLGVARIVIDPGHGGRDPGAQASGLSEADLVLDIALRLEQLLLKQPGFEVVMTRRADVFLPLEERTAIANREAADLFLSIHANASKSPSTGGVETYFLNFAPNPAAEAIAARENATASATMGGLSDLIRQITLNTKLDESRDLAGMVQRTMVRHLRTQHKSLRDLGVKQAPFVVLIGAEMPSVLAEVSFLTNRQELRLLKSGQYRQKIAEALFEAVAKYQQSLKNVGTVAQQ